MAKKSNTLARLVLAFFMGIVAVFVIGAILMRLGLDTTPIGGLFAGGFLSFIIGAGLSWYFIKL